MTQDEALTQLREVHAIQGRDGCWDIDDYMLGLYNGLELALSIVENRACKYKQRPKSQPEQCQCPNCKVTLHASDCAVHNEPAYPKGACNCGEQPKNEPVAWKLVPIKPTDEMLKAMDECSTEGYDERLYAGHAASVYMAAVDVAPTPPQRTWVGLTDNEVVNLKMLGRDLEFVSMTALRRFARDIVQTIKEKNT